MTGKTTYTVIFSFGDDQQDSLRVDDKTVFRCHRRHSFSEPRREATPYMNGKGLEEATTQEAATGLTRMISLFLKF